MEGFTIDQSFRGMDYSRESLPGSGFENCSFSNCRFNKARLNGIVFTECQFTDCDFSGASLVQSCFQEVEFHRCKLIGLAFDTCSDFLLSFRFKECNLQLSSFHSLKIPDTPFEACKLQEVDFTEADLSKSVFRNCNFSGALFGNTTLEACDFRGSRNYSLDPGKNRLKKARFSFPEVLDLLQVYGIRVD